MNHRNTTDASRLLLRGFPSHVELQGLLSPLLLSMYLLTLLGNITIIFLICSSVQLRQAPMYFFLCHIALTDVGFTSTITPKTLKNLLSRDKTISSWGCLIQMFFYVSFGNSDSFLLASMAWDRYVAICQPLHYSVLMSRKRCLQLAAVSWGIPMVHSLLYTLLISRFSFCGEREIPHFFCDVWPLLDITCSDTRVIEMLTVTEGVVVVLGPFVLIVISYIYIFYTIMRIPSASGKRKAFSTCGSHMSMVVLFYGSVSWVYFKPHSKKPDHKDMVAAVLYTVVTPMLNPFIYSFRNSEVKTALQRVIKQHFH
ncbi:hypothetical protein JRQ81_003706 [Phrynocephalus forsythii]|uniref:Olfactory receptor n=1 Tax=Phrynocephalus forsythii TaxID=171643 RepID=A0A9Q0XKD5_9SAUR|nr:hypothetical protein JRQ81_003706 [Phrynocephalus forsythii]